MTVEAESISHDTNGRWDPPAELVGCSKRLTLVLASMADADAKLEGAVLGTLPPGSAYVLEKHGYLVDGHLSASGRNAVEAAAHYVNQTATPVAVSALVDDIRARVEAISAELYVRSRPQERDAPVASALRAATSR